MEICLVILSLPVAVIVIDAVLVVVASDAQIVVIEAILSHHDDIDRGTTVTHDGPRYRDDMDAIHNHQQILLCIPKIGLDCVHASVWPPRIRHHRHPRHCD
jgi:hypothetical protein